jgi:crossover junction endodeoxyribonuclease RuvC
MRILGIDPGFDRTGWGVISDDGGRLSYIACGCLQTDKHDDFSLRLQSVRDELALLIRTHAPDAVAVEQLFFQTNAKTAIKVGMARGVVLLAIADANLPLVELTPNQVKQGTTGHGKADKKQVQEMVVRLLKLKETPKPDDAADALAIAIVGATIAHSRRS